MDFKNSKNDEWTSVMFEEKIVKNVLEEHEEDHVEVQEDEETDYFEEGEHEMQKVDMPPPWSPPLIINKDL